MDRTDFLEKCQKCAVMKKGIQNVIRGIPDELAVVYNGIRYYPYGYELSFDYQGNAVHKAILHSLTSNSITTVNLERVDKIG
jgi:hypothetical protein